MSKGLDAPQSLASVAAQLVADGYTWVARYYFKYSSYKDNLSYAEAKALSDAGLYVVAVYENGYPEVDSYFTASQGKADAQQAFVCATRTQQPKDTPIYFAVDGDVDPIATKSYFEAVGTALTGSGYEIGAYGSGAVLHYLKGLGLINHEWLSQSRGWRGYETEKNVSDIVQGSVGSYHGHDVDWDTSNGSGGGWQVS